MTDTIDYSTTNTLLEIPLAQIGPSPFQRRQQFDRLEELAESIRQHGVLQPVTVRSVATLPDCQHCEANLNSIHCEPCKKKHDRYELALPEPRRSCIPGDDSVEEDDFPDL